MTAATKIKPDILKSAAIIIKDKKLLMAREHGEAFLVIVGGSIKPHEDPIACLHRELREELGVTQFKLVDSEPFYITPLVPAASQPDKLLQMLCYQIDLIDEPHPTYNLEHPLEDEEVEELVWVGRDDLKLSYAADGSIKKAVYQSSANSYTSTHMNEDHLFPKLIQLGWL